jgi:hypothetical protein
VLDFFMGPPQLASKHFPPRFSASNQKQTPPIQLCPFH